MEDKRGDGVIFDRNATLTTGSRTECISIGIISLHFTVRPKLLCKTLDPRVGPSGLEVNVHPLRRCSSILGEDDVHLSCDELCQYNTHIMYLL